MMYYTMKHQTSITIEEEVMHLVKSKMRDGTFRNQSHLFEFAVRQLLLGETKEIEELEETNEEVEQ
jgi:Arc/MetJ-type ribon-helix-helix transcriptional regulator